MKPDYTSPDGRVIVYRGDCRDVADQLEAETFATIVTDPPYGLGFMGKGWDHAVPSVDFWQRFLRVLKPGGNLFAFGGTRKFHRMACAIEDAGFELRDTLGWLYGSGFPKSMDVSKAIDKAAGAEREVVGTKVYVDGTKAHAERPGGNDGWQRPWMQDEIARQSVTSVTAPATEAAKQFNGYGTALKPAWEPIVYGMKATAGTFARNAMEHGLAGINIDGCRVGTEQTVTVRSGHSGDHGTFGADNRKFTRVNPPGRWPANIVTDGSDEVLDVFPQTHKSPAKPAVRGNRRADNIYGGQPNAEGTIIRPHGDSGSAARFFYCAKASRRERGEGNTHPTVKPLSLLRWLLTLAAPPTDLPIFEPFAGSGTTVVAAVQLGLRIVAAEQEAEHVETIVRRVEAALAERSAKAKPAEYLPLFSDN